MSQTNFKKLSEDRIVELKAMVSSDQLNELVKDFDEFMMRSYIAWTSHNYVERCKQQKSIRRRYYFNGRTKYVVGNVLNWKGSDYMVVGKYYCVNGDYKNHRLRIYALTGLGKGRVISINI